MHMGIPVCKRAGIAEKFAYGDPITHNEIVRIWGLTYISEIFNVLDIRNIQCVRLFEQLVIYQK